MEPLPLIPKISNLSNHDTTHVLREAFQDLLGEEAFPKNVARNMEKYNLKMQELKDNAMQANLLPRRLEQKLADVTLVEEHLFLQQAKYFITKDSIVKDPRINELSKLKPLKLTDDVSDTFVKKFGLITREDILPPLPERALDFRLNSNRHLCETCEPEMKFTPPIKMFKEPQAAITTLSKSRRRQIGEKVFFEAMPKQIVFNDYELNVTYTKRIKLCNVTNVTHNVMLKQLPKMKYFSVSLQTTNKVAAGMCAVYAVRYKTDVYHDITADKIVFNTYGGKDVVVTLRSTRLSPYLRIFIFRTRNVISNPQKFNSLSDQFFDIDRTMALNASIDCGSTLIGDEVLLSIVMKNEGGPGKFFVITETDWFSNNVEHVSDNIELVVGAFRFYPAYFEIKENEFAEVALSFYPKRYGLFVETIYLLCNNNTYEELDFMGDGVYFEKSFITFDLKKKDSKPFFLDYESEYCLHLGKCLACTKHKGSIRLSNSSPLNLSYRWMLRRSNNENSKDFKYMTPHWITIKQIASIPPHSTIDFDIVLCPETTSPGLYRIVLSLYIENIPELSLRDHEEFTVIEKSNRDPETRLIDILVGEIELLCEVEKIDVVIEPNPLTLPFRLSHVDCQQTVTVRSTTNFPLICEWISHTGNKYARIKPQKFELHDVVQCAVFIDRVDVEKIEDQFLLFVNDGLQKFHFRIDALVVCPRATLSIAAIDFGYVMENFVYNRLFRVENTSSVTIRWKVTEDIVFLQEEQALCVDRSWSTVPNEGILHEGESCNVKYTADTHEHGEWLSYLKLYTNFTEEEAEPDFVCGVQYIVCKPNAVIHTDSSDLPIFCPEDVLYVGVPTQCKMCVHNLSNIVLILVCGRPTGTSATHFDITITPSVCIVNVEQNFQIDVRIVPKEMGYFEDVYVPVFILGCEKVKLVKLMCVVADITVTLLFPDNCQSVIWPEIPPEIPDEIYAGEYLSPVSLPECQHHSSLEEMPEECYAEFEEVAREESDRRTIKSNEEPILEIKAPPPSPVKISDYIEVEGEHEIDTLYRMETTDGIDEHDSWYPALTEETPDENNVTRTTITNRSTSTDQSGIAENYSLRSVFEKHFESDLILQDYMIEFKAVSLKTPVRKTIEIRNMTPGAGNVSAEVANFYPTDQPTDHFNELLAELKMAKSTAWEDLIAANGIVIKIEQTKNSIGAYESIKIDVWVYANTWGLYLDEIVIDIGQLTPFCASLLVEVVGLPVEFPIAQNSIRKDPTIRLGVVSYFVGNVKRKLKVVNVSAVAISVSWHLFINFDRPKRDFSVMFDMPDSELLQFSEEMLKGELFLTNQYYGEPNTVFFDIEPLVSHFEPHSYAYVNITTNISNFDSALMDKQIEANLIGVVRTSALSSYSSNIFARPIGSRLPLARVRITLEMKYPRLVMDDANRTIQITGFATDIMESEFTRKKTIILTNIGTCSSLLHVETDKPFKVCSVRTPQLTLSDLTSCVRVSPQECIEVTIECTLTSDDILKMVEALKTSGGTTMATPVIKDNSLVIIRDLNIYEGGYLQKTIPMEMKVFYPLFKSIPGSIKFGDVYIGDTAKSVLTLRNLTCPTMKFEVYKCHKFREFVVLPETGYIPSVKSGGTCTIDVFFTPTEPENYEEWIAVTTTITHHYIIINVSGNGTYDEKYHVSGLH